MVIKEYIGRKKADLLIPLFALSQSMFGPGSGADQTEHFRQSFPNPVFCGSSVLGNFPFLSVIGVYDKSCEAEDPLTVSHFIEFQLDPSQPKKYFSRNVVGLNAALVAASFKFSEVSFPSSEEALVELATFSSDDSVYTDTPGFWIPNEDFRPNMFFPRVKTQGAEFVVEFCWVYQESGEMSWYDSEYVPKKAIGKSAFRIFHDESQDGCLQVKMLSREELWTNGGGPQIREVEPEMV